MIALFVCNPLSTATSPTICLKFHKVTFITLGVDLCHFHLKSIFEILIMIDITLKEVGVKVLVIHCSGDLQKEG